MVARISLMKKAIVVIVLLALTAGLLGQFVWKMIYWPEPLVPVIIEICIILGLTGLAIWCEVT